MRDEFNEKTKRVIQERAGNHCSNPICRTLTSGPNAHPERSTKIGVAAHITAAAVGGPRYNPLLTSDQRRSAENGIWLCQTCAHFVDTDYQNYSVQILYDWKKQAEREADEETKGRKGQLPSPSNDSQEGWCCPFCGTVVEFGNSVCLGCNAEIILDLTRTEREQSANIGMMLGVMLAILLLAALPSWLKSSMGWNIQFFWGLGIYGLVLIAMSAIIGALISVHLHKKKKLQEPPRFFRHSFR